MRALGRQNEYYSRSRGNIMMKVAAIEMGTLTLMSPRCSEAIFRPYRGGLPSWTLPFHPLDETAVG